MKKILTLTLCLALLLGLFSGCGGKQYDPLAGVETTVFTDDAGRDVTVPAGITRIAASGSTAQMILMTLVPELLVGLASSPITAQRPYFPGGDVDCARRSGQFYGSKAQPQHGGTDRRRAAAHRRPWRCQGERPQRYGRHPEADRHPDGLPRSDARRNAAGLPQARPASPPGGRGRGAGGLSGADACHGGGEFGKAAAGRAQDRAVRHGCDGLACNAEARYRRTCCRSSAP